MSAFRNGDVVRYRPAARFPGQTDVMWCREGTAIAQKGSNGPVYLVDTYWNLSGGNDHVLTDEELATADLLFNVAEYDQLPQYDRGNHDTWARYAPADRARFTAQHGLQARYFIRKGAAEDLATQIENGRERVREAEDKLDTAQRSLTWARQDLADLEARQVAS